MLENRKREFRISCMNRLKLVSRFSKVKNDKIIVQNLYKLIIKLKARKVLLYVPLGLEVDVMPLINKLRKEKNIDVFVPFMFEDSFKIVKYRLPLKKKKFGIFEPNNSIYKSRIDLAIVPIVGLDVLNKRIGFGKGMYDRFFYRLKYKPITVFTQRELCKTSEILSNHYDIEADYIITK